MEQLALLINPMLISVLVLCVLCLKKVNVILALIFSAFVCGIIGGMGFSTTMDSFVEGMGLNSETALSYILLGTFAYAMTITGFGSIISRAIGRFTKYNKYLLLLVLLLMAIASQNLIPVHIAFIPVVIPPLLHMMNKIKLDRRAVAVVLSYGLKTPYITIPAGFGLIFQTLISKYMTDAGMSVTVTDVWHSTWFLGLGMTIALGLALFAYRKPRKYNFNFNILQEVKDSVNTHFSQKFNRKHAIILFSAFVVFLVQIITRSLPLAAAIGLVILFTTKVISHKDSDNLVYNGISMMGHIAFVMLTSAGYAHVLQETGSIDIFVNSILPFLVYSKFLTVFLVLFLGLFLTMGIGSSFGTIPIITVLVVPICIKLGLTPTASIILVTAASALGDAGSPVSDTTLGPTSGLDADGQHDHIKDTCIPTFVFYTTALIVFAILGCYVFD